MIAAQPLNLYGSEAVFFCRESGGVSQGFCRDGAHDKNRTE